MSSFVAVVVCFAKYRGTAHAPGAVVGVWTKAKTTSTPEEKGHWQWNDVLGYLPQ